MTRSSSSPEEERFIHPLGWKTDDREDEETLKLVVLCTEKKETMDKHTVHTTCTKWAPPWTLFPGGRGSYGPGKQLKQTNIQSTKPDTASSEPHPGPCDPFPGGGRRHRPENQPKWIKWAPPWTQWPIPWERGELQTRKANKEDQVSPTLDHVTHSLGEGGDTDQKTNQTGSSEPHPGPSDPFPGRGGSYRPEKQTKRIKWAPPWTMWPIPWGRGETQTRKATKVDQASPTLDPLTHSLGEGGVTDQKTNQRGSSEPHPGHCDLFPKGGE